MIGLDGLVRGALLAEVASSGLSKNVVDEFLLSFQGEIQQGVLDYLLGQLMECGK